MHVSPWNVALQFVNFLVLAWLLQHFLFKPVRAVIAKRQEAIDASMREAEARKAEAQRTIAEYGAKAAAVERAADRARQQALDAAAEEARRLRDEALRQARADAEQAKADVERQRADALRELEQRAADLARSIAERLLRDAAPDLDAPFLWRLTASIDGLDATRKAALAKQLAERGVDVLSAHPLDASTRDRLEPWLNAIAGAPVGVSYAVDPALLAGVEVRLPTSVWRSNWRASLDRIRHELVGHDVAA